MNENLADQLGASRVEKHDSHAAAVCHVQRSRQSRKHECHWPGCRTQVPPAMWGCKPHWFRLPKALRDRIWDAYMPGQEARMDPSPEYLAVAQEVAAWCIANLSDEELLAVGEALAEEGAGRAGLRQSDPTPSGPGCPHDAASVGPGCTADLSPCGCPPDAVEHLEECERARQIDARVRHLTAEQRLALIRQEKEQP